MLWRGLDPYLIVILIIPFLVLLRDVNTIFTPIGYIDPWVYFGFFHNLILYKGVLFPLTYYGSRLSWILPGYLVNLLFSPLAANDILHLGVFYIAAVSLFLTLKRTADRRTALLATIAFGFHGYLWGRGGLGLCKRSWNCILPADDRSLDLCRRPGKRAHSFGPGRSLLCRAFLL